MHNGGMRRLLLVMSAAFGCAKAPTPVTETATPATTVPALEAAEPSAVAAEEPERCGSLGTCLAMVGDVEIPYSDFAAIYDLKVAKYTDRGREIPASADRRYRKSIAQRLIYHEMLRQEAGARGLAYNADALAEREQQQRRGIRDWEKHLARRGETDASLRDMYVAELLEVEILQSDGLLDVTPEEVLADYEKIRQNWHSDRPRIRASHILVPLRPARADLTNPPSPAQEKQWEAEAKAEAKAIHQEVTQPGADFAATAKERSSGPSARKGGDIGIFTADRMAQEFSRAAFRLKVGQISKPVRTKFGYHVIKLTGSWPAGALPIEALDDQIRDRLRQRKLHEGRRLLQERLKATVEVRDNMLPTLGPEPERLRPRRDTKPAESQPPLPMARR